MAKNTTKMSLVMVPGHDPGPLGTNHKAAMPSLHLHGEGVGIFGTVHYQRLLVKIEGFKQL